MELCHLEPCAPGSDHHHNVHEKNLKLHDSDYLSYSTVDPAIGFLKRWFRIQAFNVGSGPIVQYIDISVVLKTLQRELCFSIVGHNFR